MKRPQPRLSVRMMISLVAGSAVLIWGWMNYLDPVRGWKQAIRDRYDPSRRYGGIDDAISGRVRGITPDLAIAEFAGLLGDKSLESTVRSTAAEGLGRFQSRARSVIPTLIETLKDESPSLRSVAALMIRRILGNHPEDDQPKRDSVAALVDALDDPDRRVRRMAACCLGWMGEGELAVRALGESLMAPDLNYMERRQILGALRLSGPKAVEALPAVLQMTRVDSIDEGNSGGEAGRQGNASAQIDAARFLHAYGQSERAVEVLRRIAKDRDPLIAKEAARALESMESDRTNHGLENAR